MKHTVKYPGHSNKICPDTVSPVFRMTPNVIWTTYGVNADGATPEDDLHLRLTLFLDLE